MPRDSVATEKQSRRSDLTSLTELSAHAEPHQVTATRLASSRSSGPDVETSTPLTPHTSPRHANGLAKTTVASCQSLDVV